MKPFRLGLTGSIGMGKSTTAAFFAAENIPVWDADAAVHKLYSPGGAAVLPVSAACPEAVENGGISRSALKVKTAQDPAFLAILETIVHPFVVADRAAFLTNVQSDIVILDIPLLFETGVETALDATLLVTAPPALQHARVMARPGMTEAQFQTILSRQMPDTEKRRRATHIIETLGLEAAHQAVLALIAYIRENRHA